MIPAIKETERMKSEKIKIKASWEPKGQGD